MVVHGIHHPQLKIQLVNENSRKALLITTNRAIEGETYNVSSDKCTLFVECLQQGSTKPIRHIYEVQNISPPLDGGFHGFWVIADSLLNCHELKASACIVDTTKRISCDTIIVNPKENK